MGCPGPGPGCVQSQAQGGCLSRGVSRPRPRGCVYPSMHWGRHPTPSRRLLLRTVRILLECILVNKWFTCDFNNDLIDGSGSSSAWSTNSNNGNNFLGKANLIHCHFTGSEGEIRFLANLDKLIPWAKGLTYILHVTLRAAYNEFSFNEFGYVVTTSIFLCNKLLVVSGTQCQCSWLIDLVLYYFIHWALFFS